jgi:SNF2 family DNA or RNA helicase
MTNKIVLSTAEELDAFLPLEVNQLAGLSAYSFFLERTKDGFNSFLKENPHADDRPYQYQYAAVMCCRRFNIMGWSMSVGKTTSTIVTILGLYKERLQQLRKGSIHIVVLNLLAAERWLEDFSKISMFKGLYQVVNSLADLEKTQCPIIIYSQDFPKRRASGRKYSSKTTLSKRLRKLKPTLLVVDEVHGLRSNTARTAHLKKIREKSRRCLALTGTPSEGNLKELHSILTFVYGDNWLYRSAQSFSKDFGSKQRISTSYIQKEDAPEKYLQRLEPAKMADYYHMMRRFIHRVRIDEPQIRRCMTLPEAEHVMHAVEPDQEQKDIYDLYVASHLEQLRRVSDGITKQQQAEALQLINPLIKIANFPGDGTRPTPKIKYLLDLVQRAEGKVVIFCDRVASAWLCTHHLRNTLKVETIRLYSKDPNAEPPEMNMEQRIEAVTEFQYNPNIKAGVFSITLAGQSIDLTKASDVIYYCLPWSSIKIQQSISRVVRSGNTYPEVKLHYLYQTGMIDEYQTKLALEKIRCSKLMLDYEVDFEAEETESDLTPSDALSLMFH